MLKAKVINSTGHKLIFLGHDHFNHFYVFKNAKNPTEN